MRPPYDVARTRSRRTRSRRRRRQVVASLRLAGQRAAHWRLLARAT
ncbi:hypothetical protein ACTMTI_28890 [Nonomuraea sp. H19]